MWLSLYPRRCSWIYWRVKVSTLASRCDTNINEAHSNTKKKISNVLSDVHALFFEFSYLKCIELHIYKHLKAANEANEICKH